MDLASRMVSAVTRVSSEPPEMAKPPRIGMVVDVSDAKFISGLIPSLMEKQQYPYSRPEFLYFSEDEILLSADQRVRPVLCPKYSSRMPLYAGYAEVINAGKTVKNEDQASARIMTLVQQGCDAEQAKELDHCQKKASAKDDDELMSPYDSSASQSVETTRVEAAFFAIFDGHAGAGAALVAARCLHEHIKARLSEVLELILELDRTETLLSGRSRSDSCYSISKIIKERRMNLRKVSELVRIYRKLWNFTQNELEVDAESVRSDELVIGALEAAFVDMASNAGDCRAVLVTEKGSRSLSFDFTPAAERKRLQTLAYQNPELIGNRFSRLEYSRPLTKKDLKAKVLFRDWFMNGWASKTVKECDLRPPLISDSSRKRRLLNTIGVSRGFGDHHLFTMDEHLPIKPFLSSVPEVQVYDLRNLDVLTDKDVLIIASDGLWDVLSNEDAGLIVRSSLSSTEQNEQSRYSMAAQELASAARGYPSGPNGHRWMMNSGGNASTDDITVYPSKEVQNLRAAVKPTHVTDDGYEETNRMKKLLGFAQLLAIEK